MPKLTLEQLRADLKVVGTKVPRMSVWKHYKTGDIYRVVGYVVREHDQAVCVAYVPWAELEALDGNPVVFCRPAFDWSATVRDAHNLDVPRFSRIGVTSDEPLEDPVVVEKLADVNEKLADVQQRLEGMVAEVEHDEEAEAELEAKAEAEAPAEDEPDA